MSEGMSLHIKHLATSLLTSCFSLVLIIDLKEGCHIGIDLDTKKVEDVKGHRGRCGLCG